MALKSLFLVCFVLATLSVSTSRSEPDASADPKPGYRVVHVHGEPVSRYVYTRHVHYHEPTHAHVVRYYAPSHHHDDYHVHDYHYDAPHAHYHHF